MYYTPEQTAGMLKIAKSTLRKYSQIFAGQLSQAANRTHRKYNDNDIAILSRVIELRNQNVPLSEIPGKLGIVPKSSPDASLSRIPQIAKEFETIRSQIAALDSRQSAELERLEKKLDELSAIVTETRTRGFWSRLFGRK